MLGWAGLGWDGLGGDGMGWDEMRWGQIVMSQTASVAMQFTPATAIATATTSTSTSGVSQMRVVLSGGFRYNGTSQLFTVNCLFT
jgi:hypothetical protein